MFFQAPAVKSAWRDALLRLGPDTVGAGVKDADTYGGGSVGNVATVSSNTGGRMPWRAMNDFG